MGTPFLALKVVRHKLNKTHKTQTKCEKSSTFKPANAVTRSVPNSGRSSPTNTESTQPEPTMATPTRKKVTKKLKLIEFLNLIKNELVSALASFTTKIKKNYKSLFHPCS